MNKIALIVAVLAYFIFADTLYLKDGKEIKDATVVEVGVSEVKYKVGTEEALYTAKKSDIAIIFYSDGTKDVFAESKSENMQNTATPNAEPDKYENFTTKQRWGTWALNTFTINGLGSWAIMGDVTGGLVHFGFGVASAAALGGIVFSGCQLLGDNNNDYACEVWGLGLIALPVFLVSGAIWNIHRSATYNKPHHKTAHSGSSNGYSGFNFSVLPNRYGNLMPAVTYNKTF